MKSLTNDLSLYSTYAQEWWEQRSPRFRTLQRVNEHLFPWVLKGLGSVSGKKVVDLGCGGGLLSKPLADAGALITGLDISSNSLDIARQMVPQGLFVEGSVTDTHFQSNSFDGALLSDVLEHIPRYEDALREASRILKPGAKLFVATINRTFLAKLGALWLAEGLSLVPKGTHEYSLFISPKELTDAASRQGFQLVAIQGTRPKIFKTLKTWTIHLSESQSCSVLYWAVYNKCT
jgi:2-polyprenyl-6-hydroxyphenyl methylase / 3-demethylubiquinone-9 3-methyltransferase